MVYITEEFITLSLFLGMLDSYDAMSAAFDPKTVNCVSVTWLTSFEVSLNGVPSFKIGSGEENRQPFLQSVVRSTVHPLPEIRPAATFTSLSEHFFFAPGMMTL
jgi:hypothetical protein